MNTQKKKILIIDDNADITKVLTYGLTAVGYEVQTENDPRHALKATRAFSPDLILLDMDMPKMDGGEVLERLKERKDVCDIPVIFLTGLANKEDEECRRTEMIEKILAKPISITDLARHIEIELSKSSH